ncbi:hypothetical protein [uncultured Clostridium sp.]|uniref:hypothetical protein n=1 Tax=uncultured Clostridium sp. TaxID=59620 RepID=UPI0028E898F8|nr:hypothetical protein [uncultured Clostridium sp.]
MINSKNKRTVAIILLLTFIIASYFIYNMIYTHKNRPYAFNISNIDKNIFPQDAILKTLNKSYFLNQDNKIFTSVGLINNTPNIYQMYWNTKLLDCLGKTTIYEDQIKDYIKYINLDTDNLPKSTQIEYLSEIYKTFNYNISNEEQYKSTILSKYDKNQKLFFLTSKDDDIKDKINETLIYIKALKNLGIITGEETNIKNKLIDLYNDDKFFNVDNSENSINVIRSLYYLGYRYNDLNNVMKDRKEQVKSFYSTLQSQYNDDINKSFLFVTSLDVEKFFNEKDSYVDNSFFESTISGFKDLSQMGGSKMFKSLDPQVLYNYMKYYQEKGYTFPYYESVNSYVLDNINSGFSKFGYIDVNLEDNYYGLYIANMYNFDYDKNQMKSLLEKYYTNLISEDSSIHDMNKLRNIYFLLLSYENLNMPIKDKDLIKDRVEEYLKSVELSENLKNSLDNYYIGIEIIELLDKSVSKDLRDKVDELLNLIDTNNQVYSNIDVTKVAYISSFSSKNKYYLSNTEKSLSSLYSNYGYKSKLTDDTNPSIEATYNALYIKSYFNIISKEDKENANNFIKNKVSGDIYKGIVLQNDNLTLKNIYYSIIITSYYK